MFSYRSEPHVARSDYMGYHFPYPGLYRITAEGAGYQAKTHIGFGLYKASDKHGNTELIGNFEIKPGESRKIELTQYFEPGEFFFPAGLNLNAAPDGKMIYMMRDKGARGYRGESRHQMAEGRGLEEEWPPTYPQFAHRRTVHGYHIASTGHSPPRIPKSTCTTSSSGSPKAFRRPVTDAEIESFVSLAKPHHPKDQPMHKMVRAPLRAMFSSPQFLFHAGQPGPLDDHALASRLSVSSGRRYLIPINQPCQRKTHPTQMLAVQVDRMLNDPRSNRFINDFLDGWLHLSDIDATTPDPTLYPEYDNELRQAMLAETRLHLRELLTKNLPARNFIKSDFTFVNRRLAHHYGMANISGERMRRVALPADSVRGGLMTSQHPEGHRQRDTDFSGKTRTLGAQLALRHTTPTATAHHQRPGTGYPRSGNHPRNTRQAS